MKLQIILSLALILVGCSRPKTLQAQAVVPANFWGTHFNKTTTPYPTAGITFTMQRLWDSGTTWANMQTGPNCTNTVTTDCNFTKFDTWMNNYIIPNNWDVIYTVAKTPNFISSFPTDTGCSSFNGACDPPTDVNCDGTGTDATFKGFLQALWNHIIAQGWTGKVKYVEIWNEPTGPNFWNNPYINNTLCSGTSNASRKIMARFAQDARSVIQAKEGSVLFLSPPIANPIGGAAPGGWMDNYGAAGGFAYADIISSHGYIGNTGGGAPEQICCGTGTGIKAVLDMMATYSQSGKPLWVSEGSWADVNKPTGPPDPKSWTARYLTLLLSKGQVLRFPWYGHDVGSAKTWGGSGNTLTATGDTVVTMQTWYTGATFGASGCTSTSACSGNIRACDATKTGGYSSRTAWYDVEGSTCSYTPAGTWDDYLDLAGGRTTYSGGPITLPSSPILLEHVTSASASNSLLKGTNLFTGTNIIK